MEGYMGVVTNFAGNFAPRNWSYCSGQIISIAQNTALFSLLGTTYGGNGQTTFGLPDTRGRMVIGVGQGAGLPSIILGEMAGSNSVTLTTQNLPPHNHGLAANTIPVRVNSAAAGIDAPGGAVFATSTTDNAYATAVSTDVSGALNITGNIGIAGSNVPLSLQQPSLGMNFIICMYGIYPSRN